MSFVSVNLSMTLTKGLKYKIVCYIVYFLNAFWMFFIHKCVLSMAGAETQPSVFVYISNALLSSFVLMFIHLVFERQFFAVPSVNLQGAMKFKGKIFSGHCTNN